MKAIILIFSIILLIINKFDGAHTAGTESFQRRWLGSDEIRTPLLKKYRYFPLASISKPMSGCVSFKVQAKHDAHISLKNLGSDSNIVEIVLGGWSNTQSVIREQINGQIISLKRTPNILDEHSFKEFWLNWNNGTINIGKAGETQPFLSESNPDLLPINFLGVMTCCGATSTWIFLEPNCPPGSDHQKPSPEIHQIESADINPEQISADLELQESLLNDISFHYKFCTILEKPSKEILDLCLEQIEIALNKSKAIHEKMISTYLGNLGDSFRQESKIFTEIGNTFYKFQTKYHLLNNSPQTVDLSNTRSLPYEYFSVDKSVNCLKFEVIAQHEFSVALSEFQTLRAPFYEIIFGVENNTRTVIRMNSTEIVAEAYTPEILNNSIPRHFWISWSPYQIVVGRESENVAILMANNTERLNVNFIGFYLENIGRGGRLLKHMTKCPIFQKNIKSVVKDYAMKEESNSSESIISEEINSKEYSPAIDLRSF